MSNFENVNNEYNYLQKDNLCMHKQSSTYHVNKYE